MRKGFVLSLCSLVLGAGLALAQNPPETAPAPLFNQPFAVADDKGAAAEKVVPPVAPGVPAAAPLAPALPASGSSCCDAGACGHTTSCCDDHCNWTGFYIGANGGWGYSNFNPVISPSGPTAIADFSSQLMSFHAHGPLFGIQGGFNWQKSNWVLGVEGDYDGSGSSGTKQLSTISMLHPVTASDTFMTTDKINALASIRGRIGYALGSGLLYFTGGFAWEDLTRDTSVNAETAPAVFGQNALSSVSGHRTGYVLGGGYEWMVAKHWTVRGEYLFNSFNHTDMDTMLFLPSATPDTRATVTTGQNDVHVFRIGINYKF